MTIETYSHCTVKPTPVPTQSHRLALFIRPIYNFFDWLYGSNYNPLYRSGTLAVGFLCVLLVTGLYLCFFYSVSTPYESLAAINSQIWIGRWIRTLHRYATVATVVAIVFHIIQLLAQGKCWGPRLLAWLSGLVLVGMFLISAWSGYVMMWDLHGQMVAISGAKMLAQFPILRDVVNAAFDGTSEIPSGFFFMNLFIHVAIPLAMILFLWVHTARLSRSIWFPNRRIFISWTLGLTVLAMLWPAPLLKKANLLQIVGKIPTDISTGLWMSWLTDLGSLATWAIFIVLSAMMAWLPWWWRPKLREMRPKSKVDTELCSGCTQCTRDCPYEAIRMVPRQDGKRLIAEILPSNCVSCGICAASCADFAIGPEGRTAIDQRSRAQLFCDEIKKSGGELDLILVACTNNHGLGDILKAYEKQYPAASVYSVECCGCMHSAVLEVLLQVSKGCALIGCPARNCFNRDGGDLLAQRIFARRVPFLDRGIDRTRLMIAPYSAGESARLTTRIVEFHNSLNAAVALPQKTNHILRHGFAVLVSVGFLCLCAFAAQVPMGTDITHGLVRVAGNLPSASKEECRSPGKGELDHLPLHMRTRQICEKRLLTYQLIIRIDGRNVAAQKIGRSDGRVDLPIFLDIETPIQPGRRVIEIILNSDIGASARCQMTKMVEPGAILLGHYQREVGALVCDT